MNPSSVLRPCSTLLACWLAASLPAQLQDPQPAPPPTPMPQIPYQRTPFSRSVTEGLNPVWVPGPTAPQFSGFPSFNPKLSGYGTGYPRRAGDLAAAGLLPMPVVPPSAEETGWPSWVRARAKVPLTYTADKALLVRHSDRVWWKAPDEEAFVPLYFYDKLCLVAAGTDIEVRQTGDFELVLHGGSRVVSLGRSAMRIEALTEKTVELRLAGFTRLRLELSTREHLVHLPDGSSLAIPPDVSDPPIGPANLVIERAIEPSWFGGRATIFNGGARPVQWTHAFGTVAIAPGERVGFFLAPPTCAVPAALTAVDATTTTQGPVLTGVAEQAGTVSWSGARFKLQAGASVRLDPMLGDPFAPPPPPKPAEKPPAEQPPK